MNDAYDAATLAIARDLDAGAVRECIRRLSREGRELTVRGIANEVGLPTHRVTPHVEEVVQEWIHAGRPERIL